MNQDDLDLVTEVFGQYMEVDEEDEESMYLPTDRLGDVVQELGLNNKLANQLAAALDPDSTGRVMFEPFTEAIAMRMDERTSGDAYEAFKLFKKGGNGPINIEDLRQISRLVVKDGASDEQLAEMLSLSNMKTTVGLQDFERIMKEANAL